MAKGTLSGTVITLNPNGGDVYWTYAVDSHIDPAFRVKHTDSISGDTTPIAQGTKPGAVHVDFGVADLVGDTLAWRIFCLPFAKGKWPVYVQFFQGTQATGYNPISDVIEYEVDLTNAPSETINDSVIFA
jgi:hypothetical protein